MTIRNRFILAGALAAACLGFAAVGGSTYGFSYFDLTPGAGASGIPGDMLGAPVGTGAGQGSSHVYQLGVGGSVSMLLGSATFDGPGTDLIVCENPFKVAGTDWINWVELMTVEVSSDASTWAAFPTRYDGQVGPFGNFQGLPADWYRGWAGIWPVFADPEGGVDIHPYDVVGAGGDAFDLADLADHPAVLAGDVDLGDIRYVRLTDVIGGGQTDSQGTLVFDCGDAQFNFADVDAVVTLHNGLSESFGRPRVELSIDASDVLTLHLEDAEGLNDLKFGIACSWNGVTLDFYNQILPFMLITAIDSESVTLAIGPLPSSLPTTHFKVSATDNGGEVGGDAIVFP